MVMLSSVSDHEPLWLGSEEYCRQPPGKTGMEIAARDWSNVAGGGRTTEIRRCPRGSQTRCFRRKISLPEPRLRRFSASEAVEDPHFAAAAASSSWRSSKLFEHASW
eukprot:TRINITY_DN35396_c0_g1_i1.p1 TRINITY_DN35396_c0_g1~~TRINITY_DN35396_c0_g1_i1.p1  ORF type:complete len:107 (-),score=12.05 TRINITY_DN35396_c0_g1_i1:21-341(-)